MMNKSAVTVEDLRVVRGKRLVLPGLSCELPHGRVTGLLGPSGCGKTTLIRSIVGVQRVAGGRVDVLGHPAGSRPLRDKIGYVTQEPSVYDILNVTDNVRFFARVLGAPQSDVPRVIEQVGLTSHADDRVDQLSGGQRSRASLAVALLGDPSLLVLDEPTVGLDPVLRMELWALFADLARAGTTLLISSHVMDEASRCDHLMLMREGRILAADTPDALCASTGSGSIEDAFLTLIRAKETA
ncbi:MAG: ABC transporter ATP-binding protein [Nocardioidaceae bacterium]